MRRYKKKGLTKLKLRNSTRAFLMIIALGLFIVSSCMFYINVFEKKEIKIDKKVYDYTNKYNLDYQVNIINNNFIDETNLSKDNTYVSDLIESLSMDIDYQYNSTEKTTVKYGYKIDAIIGASYTQDGQPYEIWNKTYNLKEVTDQETTQNININESVDVNYQKYHNEIKSFEQTMGMSIDASLYIKLTVNTTTKVNNKDINNQYISDFSITIGDKVAKVDAKFEDENEKHITDKVTMEGDSSRVAVVFSIIGLAIASYIIYYVRYKTYTGYSIRNEFKLELNRILKSCQDRIVMVKSKLELEQENIIDVKNFAELIKLSEELYKPILYWKSEEDEEAYFCVMSNKINYRYILKKFNA